MGYVRVKGSLGDPERHTVLDVDFLTDTGAFFTTISVELAEKLGIRVVARTKATLANKTEVEVGLSYAYVKILDREATLPVAIMDVPEPLLGVTTLEGLGLKVDPVSGAIEKTRTFTVGMLQTA
jgi:Predicted aspartyl protease